MRNLLLTLCVAVAAVGLSPALPAAQQQQPTRPATVRLKGGEAVTGAFVRADIEAVVVIVGGSEVRLDAGKVAAILFDAAAAGGEPGGAERALKALRRMGDATEAGISFVEYSRRAVDLKVEVEESLRELDDGELKAELEAALAAYVAARAAWADALSTGGRTQAILVDRGVGKLLVEKYKVPNSDNLTFPQYALPVVWAAARRHVERATSLGAR